MHAVIDSQNQLQETWEEPIKGQIDRDFNAYVPLLVLKNSNQSRGPSVHHEQS